MEINPNAVYTPSTAPPAVCLDASQTPCVSASTSDKTTKNCICIRAIHTFVCLKQLGGERRPFLLDCTQQATFNSFFSAAFAHYNVTCYAGVCIEPDHCCTMHSHCPKTHILTFLICLHDRPRNSDVGDGQLSFKQKPLAADFLLGLQFLSTQHPTRISNPSYFIY